MISPFPHDPHYDLSAPSLTRVFDSYSDAVQKDFHRLGATGVRVTVWARRDTPQVKHVILDSVAFRSVDLSLEQTNLLLTHLRENSSTDMAFVMAQAIETGMDVEAVYDSATGMLKTPHAALKEEVAA